jgi:hemoglobin-like flavoprotein
VTPEHIRTVQSTWRKVLPIKDSAAQLFYKRLFEMDPSLRGLFRGDMRQQGEKLIQVMDAAVNGLSRLERMIPSIQELGRRHVDYGVKDHHYGTVGAALLWTLGKALGAEFTPEVKDAWAAVYAVLATTMREAAVTALCEGRLAPRALDFGSLRARHERDTPSEEIEHYCHSHPARAR